VCVCVCIFEYSVCNIFLSRKSLSTFFRQFFFSCVYDSPFFGFVFCLFSLCQVRGAHKPVYEHHALMVVCVNAIKIKVFS